MINPAELRPGNYLLHKAAVRILPIQVSLHHFELMAKGHAKDFFPLPLKPDLLLKCGFSENKKYYQYPEIREFVLPLAIKGSSNHQVSAYVKEGTTTYARAMVNEVIISNHIHYLHQLQNLVYALTAVEMDIQL